MALLRHSGIYLAARVISGAASFVLIVVYTRLLDAATFGELALALAAVGFFSGLIVDGLMLALLRYMPVDPAEARATMLWGLVLPAAALCCVIAASFLLFASARWRIEGALCAGLLLAIIVHRFQLAIAQGELHPGKYTLLTSLESLLDMVVGIGLVLLGYAVAGALLGTLIGTLIAVAVNWRSWWVARRFFDAALARQMLQFGTPLMLSALFSWIATFGDRWLLDLFLGAEQTGLYAAGYDLQMNLLGVPMIAMQLAGLPLVISAFAERGAQAAQLQLRLLGTFVILIFLPAAVGIVLTGPLLAAIFLGGEFRPLTVSLLPILVAATFCKILMTYLNYAFFLAERTGLTLVSMITAAAIDIALNLLLIPHYGPWGSAVAALVAFGAGFAIAALKMPSVFAFPIPNWTILLAGLGGVAAMSLWLLPFYGTTSPLEALYIIPIAVLIHFAAGYVVLLMAGRQPLDILRNLWSAKTTS